MTLYDVRHVTRSRYAQPVRFARANLRLKPIAWAGQRLERHALVVTPTATVGSSRLGPYLANVARMLIEKPTSEVVIESRFRIAVDRPAPEADAGDPCVAEVAAAARGARTLDAASPTNYLPASPLIALDPAIADWCAAEIVPDRGVVEAALALARRIRAEFRYDGDATRTDTPPAEAFAKRHGVCQDFAQVMITGLRTLGLSAAYVSGYLRTLPPPGRPRLVGADATHAWVLVWCGEKRGWIGFDPTNGCAMGESHIITAIGRDYADVAPIDGIHLGRGGQRVEVSVDVEPVSP